MVSSFQFVSFLLFAFNCTNLFSSGPDSEQVPLCELHSVMAASQSEEKNRCKLDFGDGFYGMIMIVGVAIAVPVVIV